MDEEKIDLEQIASEISRDIGGSDADNKGVSGGADWLSLLQAVRENTESIEDKENKQILDMRKKWSKWILFFIGVVIVFDIILVACYGFGWWDFDDSTVVIAVITESFLKIIGLGFIITREIFKKIY